MIRRLACLISIPLLIVALIGEVRADSARTERLFDLMQLQEILRGFPESLLEGMDENADVWSGDAAREAVGRIAREHFSAAVLARDLRLILTHSLDADAVAASIAFYESDLGRRIVAMEVAAADPALSDVVETEGKRIYRDLVGQDAPRVGQIRRLNEALSVMEWGMAMVMNMAYAMFGALYGGEDGASEEEILAMINSGMGGFRTELEQLVNAEQAYVYRALSDEDFERYLDFLETPGGQALSEKMLAAMRIVMVERARGFGTDLRVLRGQRRS